MVVVWHSGVDRVEHPAHVLSTHNDLSYINAARHNLLAFGSTATIFGSAIDLSQNGYHEGMLGKRLTGYTGKSPVLNIKDALHNIIIMYFSIHLEHGIYA